MNDPQIIIVEQPASTRFRYESEGRLSTKISGVSGKKTFPTIRIVDYNGPLKIVVSCVTKNPPYKPHPHKLVSGNDIYEHGICSFNIPINNGQDIAFKNFSVQSCGKKNIIKSLSQRERAQVDPFKTGFMHKLKPDSIDLNCIRLCFQVFLETTQGFISLQPIVSEPIYDKKAVNDLKICMLSHNSASVAGGTEMCILCEKVSKVDIEVRFFHEESNWEAIAELTNVKVFKQAAIVFKTPEYRTKTCNPEQVKEVLNVQVQLRRISDGETSSSSTFQLTPLTSDCNRTNSLKRKRENYNVETSGLIARRIQAEATRNPYVIKTKLPHKLNEKKEKIFELPMDTESYVKAEPWEMPPKNDSLNKSMYMQPQMSSRTQIPNYVHSLNEDSFFKTRQITNKNQCNIESEKISILSPERKCSSVDTINSDSWINDLLTKQITNKNQCTIESEKISILSPERKCSSVDTLNSDSWITDLLETINKDGSLPANETLIANNVTNNGSSAYFSNINQMNNNNLSEMKIQQVNNFINNIQESNPSFANSHNIFDAIKPMRTEMQDFNFVKNDLIKKENKGHLEENI